MCAAAELHAVAVAHIHDADDVAVLFSEQSHGAQAACFSDRHFLYVDMEAFQHGLVDHPLHGGQLLRLHGGGVGKVKAQSVRLHQRTGLMHVIS